MMRCTEDEEGRILGGQGTPRCQIFGVEKSLLLHVMPLTPQKNSKTFKNHIPASLLEI